MEWYTLNFRKLVVSRDRKMGVRSGGETERKELVNDKETHLCLFCFGLLTMEYLGILYIK
jgi:hypothetical protein